MENHTCNSIPLVNDGSVAGWFSFLTSHFLMPVAFQRAGPLALKNQFFFLGGGGFFTQAAGLGWENGRPLRA